MEPSEKDEAEAPLTEKERKESRSIIAVLIGLGIIAISFFYHVLSPLFSDPKP